MKIDLSFRSKKMFFFLLIFIGFVFACVKNETNLNSPTKGRDLARIMDAKEWLNNNLPPDTKSESEWKSLWEYAFTDESNSSETVEIPLSFLNELVNVMPECKIKFIETGEYKYIQNITRLIVEKSPETGLIRGFFMSIVPSLKYLEKTNFKPFNNSYLEKDFQFDGCIIFRDIEGTLVNGWTYSDGKIISLMKPANTVSPATKSTEYCQTTFTVTYIMWTYSNNDNVDYSDFVWSESTSCWISYDYASFDDPLNSGGTYLGGPSGATMIKGITYDKKSSELIKPVVETIELDCAGAALLNSLSNYGIKFEYVVGQGNPMSFRPDSKRITWNLEIVSAPQVFHELFHAYQQMRGGSLSKNLNAEIEAYLAFYKYSIKNGFDLPGQQNLWKEAFQPYITDPSQNNYQTMADFVRNLGYTDYIDNPDLRSAPNINTLFNCY